ncbi:MAG: hypothetical protein E3J72_22050 [Planctomycetota bacterium]|nr:MAG: hypothetical protein E3J72_22050 [Planctomycetota bacterium]
MFVPASYNEGTPVALIVGLHGSGGSPDQMMRNWKPVAGSNCFIVVAPSGCSANAEAIRDDAKTKYNILVKHCYVGGFSQGGIESGTRAVTEDTGKKWAAIFMMSCGFLHTPPSWDIERAAWKIPVYWSCSQSDGFYSHVQGCYNAAVQYDHPTVVLSPSGGHSPDIHDYNDCWSWISAHSSP